MNRYIELDSLRGIAAFSVMLSHVLIVYPAFYQNTYDQGYLTIINWLKYSPLHLFWVGQEAVLFFFILSGFVLYLPYRNKRQLPYKKYLIKRICRIYLPYLATLLFAYLLRSLSDSEKIPELSYWFNELWSRPYSWETIASHFSLVGSFDTNALNPVIWSLVDEMRISILFPLLAAFVLRYNWKIVALLCVFLSSLHCGLIAHGSATFHYAAMFLIGATLAKNQTEIVNWFCTQRRGVKIILFAVATFLYTIRWSAYGAFESARAIGAREYIAAVGIIIFIIVALSSNTAKRILHMRPVEFLGKISYSLYLVHMPILIWLLHTFHETIAMNGIALLVIVVSLLVASLSYYMIELPAIRFGKAIIDRM